MERVAKYLIGRSALHGGEEALRVLDAERVHDDNEGNVSEYGVGRAAPLTPRTVDSRLGGGGGSLGMLKLHSSTRRRAH
jgi:hypothetical protein